MRRPLRVLGRSEPVGCLYADLAAVVGAQQDQPGIGKGHGVQQPLQDAVQPVLQRQRTDQQVGELQQQAKLAGRLAQLRVQPLALAADAPLRLQHVSLGIQPGLVGCIQATLVLDVECVQGADHEDRQHGCYDAAEKLNRQTKPLEEQFAVDNG